MTGRVVLPYLYSVLQIVNGSLTYGFVLCLILLFFLFFFIEGVEQDAENYVGN